ncbi:MAG: hypothetical protein AAGH78_10055 [Cyanobacteria bacterium P01_H01_bin.58]
MVQPNVYFLDIRAKALGAFIMKSFIFQCLILLRGLAFVSVFCGLSLALLSWPVQGATSDSGGDEFPGQTQGGGTH